MPNQQEIVKAIFQLDLEHAAIDNGLKAVASQFGKITTEVNKQNEALKKLQEDEKKLIAARDKTNNPTKVVMYNQKLIETQNNIKALTATTKGVETAQKSLGVETEKLSKQLTRTFQATTLNGLRAQLREAEQELASVSEGAKKFLSETAAAVDKPTNAFTRLKQEIKIAKGELATAFDSGTQEQIAAAAEKVDDLKDELERLQQTGSKLERLPSLFGSIASNLASFDFTNANKQSQQLLAVTKSITFKEAGKGIKDLGSTLLNVGKSLLLNPIFLLGFALTAIIANFDKLKESGGAVGKVFKGIDNGIGFLEASFFKLTDAIGATTHEFDLLIEKEKIFFDKTQNIAKEIFDARVALQKAAGKEGVNEELKSLEVQKNLSKIRVKLIEDEYARKGISTRNFTRAELDELQRLEGLKKDAQEDGIIRSESEIRESEKRIRELRRIGFSDEDRTKLEELDKIQRDSAFKTAEIKVQEATKAKEKIIALNNEIATEAAKSKSFDIEFKLSPLSTEQIKKGFDLQRAEVARNKAEEIRQAKLDFSDSSQQGAIIFDIKRKFALQNQLLNKQEQKAQIDAEKQLAQQQIDIREAVNQKTIDGKTSEIETINQLEQARLDIITANTRDETLMESNKIAIKTLINEKYYAALIQLQKNALIQQTAIASDEIKNLEADIQKRKDAKLDTTVQDLELAQKQIDLNLLIQKSNNDLAVSEENSLKTRAENERAFVDAKLAEETDLINQQQSREATQLTLRNARQSTQTKSLLKAAKERLELLHENDLDFTEQFRAEQDNIALLEKQAHKERLLENIGFYEQISQAALNGANQVVAAKLQEVQGQIDLQQKRVDEARDIAGDGNAELLELEKKRLSDLQKEREKFVRSQQALAVIELISNTAIAVSKAAAEGGVAAGVTIAATLIALVAGLASARSIASEAAFYDGGEFNGQGFTGNGNPREVSTGVGAKPYVYHKREFIFNHQTTDQYHDIFSRIHAGQVNLRDWEKKSQMFDMMRSSQFNTNHPFVVNNAAMDPERMDNVEALLKDVIAAVHSIPGTDFSVDEHGWQKRLKKFESRRNFIDKLAR